MPSTVGCAKRQSLPPALTLHGTHPEHPSWNRSLPLLILHQKLTSNCSLLFWCLCVNHLPWRWCLIATNLICIIMHINLLMNIHIAHLRFCFLIKNFQCDYDGGLRLAMVCRVIQGAPRISMNPSSICHQVWGICSPKALGLHLDYGNYSSWWWGVTLGTGPALEPQFPPIPAYLWSAL